MWNVSEPLANLLFDVSGVLLILGAAMVAIGTYGTIKMGGAKEYFANERISENERVAAGAMKDAAHANERAENARLEQEKLKQIVKWRTVEPTDMRTLIAELGKGGGDIDVAFSPSDPESEYFALAIIGGAFRAINESSGTLKWHVYLRPWTSNGMFFGLAIPGPENDQVTFLRRAFSAAHIVFSTENPPDEVSPITLGNGLKYTLPPKHGALIVVGLKQPPL